MSRFIPGSNRRVVEQIIEENDWSQILNSSSVYNLNSLLPDLGLNGGLTVLAFDPIQGLLAAGTDQGQIHIWGKAPVHVSWNLGRPVGVKHLYFKPGGGYLTVVDAKETLFVYDLIQINQGKPHRDASLSLRSIVISVETSAAHSLVFLGGKDGTVDVFNLETSTIVTESRIPNLWLAQEEILRKSGVPGAFKTNHIPMITDLKAHPVDPSLLLIGYEGGVVLWNLALKRAEKVFEFVIPPGASGGGNDGLEVRFTERRPRVTCLAWRPDGTLFAVGHEDGCISFCSPLDEVPITIRTLERDQVHKMKEEDFNSPDTISNREPVFKLSWSTFPSGQVQTHADGRSVLTILGGSVPSDHQGLCTFDFPAYQQPKGSLISNTGNLAPAARTSLSDSIQPIGRQTYSTAGPPEDFFLLPRKSPYGGMSIDPHSILITTPSDPEIPGKGIELWSFPPSAARPPKKLTLPSTLTWTGLDTCSWSEIFSLPKQTYARLTEIPERSTNRIQLFGGKAFSSESADKTRKTAAQRANPNVHRVIVSSHADLTIRFHDVSEDLIAPHEIQENEKYEPDLGNEFPKPLHHLTIDIGTLLLDPLASSLRARQEFEQNPLGVKIEQVSFSTGTCDLVALLSTGEVLIFKLSNEIMDRYLFAKPEGKAFGPPHPVPTVHPADSYIDIGSIIIDGAYKPFASFSALPGQEFHLKVNDVGFFALSSGASLLVVDLRGPSILHYNNPAEKKSAKGKKNKVEDTSISSISWAISKTMNSHEDIFQLLTIHRSGTIQVYEVFLATGEWVVSSEPKVLQHNQASSALYCAVLDVTGRECEPSIRALDLISLKSTTRHSPTGSISSLPGLAKGPPALRSFLVVTTPSSQAGYFNIDGPKSTAQGDDSRLIETYGPVVCSKVVYRQGCSVLVNAHGNGLIRVLRLPTLEEITKQNLRLVNKKISRISISSDGDILIHSFSPDPHISLYSLFNARFKIPSDNSNPYIQLHDPLISVPLPSIAAMNSTTSSIATFFSNKKVYSGQDIESFLGGGSRTKDRPNPPTSIPIVQEELPSQGSISARKGSLAPTHKPSQSEPSFIQSSLNSTQGMLANANEALSQRGEALSSLGDKLSSMADGAAKFASDAKKSAQREVAKKSITGSISGFFK